LAKTYGGDGGHVACIRLTVLNTTEANRPMLSSFKVDNRQPFFVARIDAMRKCANLLDFRENESPPFARNSGDREMQIRLILIYGDQRSCRISTISTASL
jgi:hypothetical protein